MSDNRPTQPNGISAILGLLAFLAMISSLGFMTYHVGAAAYQKLVHINQKVEKQNEK